LRRQTIPHAFLFTGIAGVGKSRAAVEFAKACNCRKRRPSEGGTPAGGTPENGAIPCGSCGACRKIEAGVHPDILRLKPTRTFIRIDSIRSLQHTLSMRPYEARVRVVIVQEAQHMRPEAANAFLKLLEEPPPDTVLILIAERVSEVMPTVVSRCRRLHFNPIPQGQLAGLLVDEADVTTEQARTVAAFSGGSLSRSLELLAGGWFRLRDWLVDEFERLPQMPVGRIMALGERLSADRRRFEEALDVLVSWLRDLMIVGDYPEGVVHRDQQSRLRRQAALWPLADLSAGIRAVRRAQTDLRANVGPRLIAETLLLQLVPRQDGRKTLG